MQFEDSRFYRVKAVAEALDVSVATIYRAIESGQLEAVKHGNGKGTLRISGVAVNAYLKQCSQAAYETYVAGSEPVFDSETAEMGEVA